MIRGPKRRWIERGNRWVLVSGCPRIGNNPTKRESVIAVIKHEVTNLHNWKGHICGRPDHHFTGLDLEVVKSSIVAELH